jgi:two-component system, response regulator
VILTTSDLDEDLVRAYGLGANSFVRRPVDFDAFQRAVERIALYWRPLRRKSSRGFLLFGLSRLNALASPS